MNTLIVYGTRPEYIKLLPLIKLLGKECKTCHISQHTDIINFGNPDYSVLIESNNNSDRLNSIFSEICLKLSPILKNFNSIIIQGDTATVCASSICAFNLKKDIFYVESGLRSFDFSNPFPEEAYRQITARLATVNFCPTQQSKINLLTEKVLGEIHVVGNTSLDNLLEIKNQSTYSNNVLVTLHRNENLPIIHKWLTEIDRFASKNKELNFIFPAHPNPTIKEACKNLKSISVLEPLSHNDLLKVLLRCKFVITDSGGIQEEACFLNKKIIVCRKRTERPEGINTGHLILCTSPTFLYKKLENINSNYTINTACPYGDGNSSEKIKNIITSVNERR